MRYCYYRDFKCNGVCKSNMVSIRKKRQTNRRLPSQLDDFDQDIFIGNAASERQVNIIVNESDSDRYFTVCTSSDNLVINEKMMNLRTLEGCFNKKIDKEMSGKVDTVEDRI